jgi:type I restriction-modification system DNA methylase subunit
MGTKEFHNSLVEVANKVKRKPDMSEGGISSVFVDSGFFKDLGYKDIGIDIKSQERLRGPGKIPDFECLDDFEQSIFVLELKKPTNESIRPLESYLDDQLKDRYVIPKRSRYGILSNGIKFYLYKREQNRLIEALKVEDLSVISESDAQAIYNALKKPSYEYTDLSQILEELRQIDPKPLSEEENREAFYQIFRLKQEESGLPTKFTRLVLSLMNLFDELRENGEKSEFLEGSYRFWKQSYAHKPSKVPESWSRIKKIGKKPSEETLYKFMFCLETAHNIVSKLILAKVCEDAEFKNVSSLKKLEAYMNLKFGEGRVNLIAYPFAIKETFDSLRSYLVSSIFEDDIFDWWQDCEIRVGKEVHEWRSRPNYAVEQFGEALARIFFALRSFEFSEVQEDILGELYQHYFDPETRKALGEFYTPIEVVDYILDAVDYKGQKILQQRLLDPACGSGAFVVEALKRYLRALDKQIEKKGNPEVLPASLRDLCERPKIIGFDINPFARLMAQMRFMMEIIPYYKKAQEIDPNFVLTTIPIFRTDSLEVETKTGRFQKQLGEFAGDIKFHMRLPVISKEAREEKDQFLPISFNIPAWERVRDILKNKDNYFLLLKHSFEVIKDHAQKEKWEVDREALKKKYEERFADAETLAGIMLEYVDPILRQIKVLRQEYSDGRLIKTIEDLVLAGVLKNYFLYDYVVGNPPYVRNDLIPKEQKTIYERHYESPFKGYDLYFLFIEAGLKWLLQDGLLGYICSNQFMTRTYGKNLRSYILVNSGIHQIIDFTDSGVFKDATNYPTILIFGKENVEKFTCVKVFKPKAQILNDIKIHLSDSKYSEPSYKIFQIDQKKLTEDIWSLAPEDEERVLKRVFGNSNCTIGEKCKVVSGTRIGKDNLFIGTIEKLGENKVKFLPQEYKKQPSFFDVDKELLKPILKGRDVRRWRISWQEFYMIFPHVEKDSKLEIIPEPVLKEKYVATYNYFQKHKDILEKRIWFDKNPTQLHGAYYAIMYSDSPSTYNNSRRHYRKIQ